MNLQFIEDELGKSTWFAGDELTGADIMMSFPIQISLHRGDTSGISTTRMKAFLKRMEERPAYQRAVEKGGPLDVV
jgi:glutathione S-transferase